MGWPGIGAIAVYLVEQQLLPWDRACEVMEDLLGISMSQGTLCSLIERSAKHLMPMEERLLTMKAQVEDAKAWGPSTLPLPLYQRLVGCYQRLLPLRIPRQPSGSSGRLQFATQTGTTQTISCSQPVGPTLGTARGRSGFLV
ncbi:MAG TPA: transposase [Ktedonobacteraceae bacterium]|nr:transposase [Ktedonobacteraceae bacterium]